jgi:hypothetical protein
MSKADEQIESLIKKSIDKTDNQIDIELETLLAWTLKVYRRALEDDQAEYKEGLYRCVRKMTTNPEYLDHLLRIYPEEMRGIIKIAKEKGYIKENA